MHSRFRGISTPMADTIWLGGFGAVLRSVDAGHTWHEATPVDDPDAQYRSVVATGADHAIAMASGPGTGARIWRTIDGGYNWQLTYAATDERVYLNCLAFFGSTGFAIGDQVDGRFFLLRTDDDGASWALVDDDARPPAKAAEGCFAASGACLVARDDNLWLTTGGIATPRILRGDVGTGTWTAVESHLVGGPTAGGYALAFGGDHVSVVVGGDHLEPTADRPAVSLGNRTGEDWQASPSGPRGYCSGVAVSTNGAIVAVGPDGSHFSIDSGQTWTSLSDGFDAVVATPDGSFWAAGAEGRVAHLVLD